MSKIRSYFGNLASHIFACMFITLLVFCCAESRASSIGDKPQPILKVGFIMVGSASDMGWNYAHEQGRLYLDAKLKGKVQTTMAENVPESSDAERVLEKIIAQGAKLIFATAYGYLEPAEKVATRHPDVIIMYCGSRLRPSNLPNLATYFGRQDQAAYVVGAAAGYMSKKDDIGWIGGHPVPQMVKKLDAFALGVQSVNPKARVRVIWTNSWSDAAMEAEATKSLVEQGADVIASGDIDNPTTVVRTAETLRTYSLSYNCSNIKVLAPKYGLVSTGWNWGPLYVKVAESVLDHTWKAADYRYDLKDGYIKLSAFGNALPKTVQANILSLFEQVADGKRQVFKGPIKDRDGKLRVPDGKIADERSLEKIDWFVSGVIGSAGK